MAAVESAAVVKKVLPWLALGAGALTVHTAWNLRRLRRPAPAVDVVTEDIAVLIPARDEELHIGSTLASVQQQELLASLQIHVLDDGSRDSTAAIAQAIALTDSRVQVHEEPDEAPPVGWLGKNYACARLADRVDAQVLVFLDADVRLEPTAIAALVDELRSGDFDLVAPYPRQEASGVLERLVQPLLVWSWVTTVPLRIAEERQWASMSVANGQLMVFDAQAYRKVSGHASVRGDVIEDVALMRRIRETGLRAATVDGSTLAVCRMYDSPTDLLDGYTKSAWRAFGGPAGSIGVNAVLIALYVVPAIAAITGRGSTRVWGAVGYGAGVAGRALVAQHTGERMWPDALAHPASIAAFAGINALSWWRRVRGTTRWKGRSV